MNKNYIVPNEWSIIENGFDAENVEASESLFSIGNGSMGQRANFEEDYSSGGCFLDISHYFVCEVVTTHFIGAFWIFHGRSYWPFCIRCWLLLDRLQN